ncbi:MAG: flagellar protein [Bacteroidales bacterium]|nr:flagellar protein [Bacteroidales bacterium]MCM1415144.1 flagellar protein [bacterium]MCM1423020.1 flagellar protein [bacterium]
MKIQGNSFPSIAQLQDQYLSTDRKKEVTPVKGALSFQDILTKKTDVIQESGEVKFSKHAANRLSDRNIELTDEQVERLNLGAAKASAKGISESLVIVDSLAFIVSVPNQTVITAMDQSETDENVFTNIDGAVII